MSKYKLFFVLILFVSLSTTAKKFGKDYFIKTSWFSQDSLFRNSDTVKIAKHMNYGRYDWNSTVFAEDPYDYCNGQDYVDFELNENDSLRYIKTLVKPWLEFTPFGKKSWKFNEQKQRLSLLIDKKTMENFTIVSEDTIMIRSKFSEGKGRPPVFLKTIELTLVRVKN